MVSVEQMAATFNMQLVDTGFLDLEPFLIKEGDECEILIDGECVLTGYIDDPEDKYDAKSDTISAVGRSKSGDLVDCSAIHKTGEWENAKIGQIAKDICRPFGISVDNLSPLGDPFTKFKIEEGETAAAALQRMAGYRGLMVFSDALGTVIFTKAKATKIGTAIVRDRPGRAGNILKGSRTRSLRDRFSEYRIKAQAQESDSLFGEDANAREAIVRDRRVPRYRPLVILPDDADDNTDLKERARWERNTRFGKAQRVTYTVPGWKHDGENLWKPNTVVAVDDNRFRIAQDLYIVSCNYREGAGGELTDIVLTSRAAFDTLELPEPPADDSGGFFGLF